MATISRQQAVAAIRAKLLEMVDDEHCMCQVAAEKGIYCHGFAALDEAELNRRYAWIARRHPGVDRKSLEDLANRWQLARQVVHDAPISCDVQQCEHDTCMGWDTFDAAALSRLYREIVGEEIAIEG